MKLLLTSFGHEYIPRFVSGTVAYVPDAARSHGEQPTANVERDMLRGHGLSLRELPLADTPPREVVRVLEQVDGVYVAGGETFDLLWVLHSTGSLGVLRSAVAQGLPYIGCSAGSVIAGPSIEPVSLLDSPAVAPSLRDYRALGLIDRVLLPHAGGDLESFPIGLFADTVRRYGADWPLTLLRDGEALLVDEAGTHLI